MVYVPVVPCAILFWPSLLSIASIALKNEGCNLLAICSLKIGLLLIFKSFLNELVNGLSIQLDKSSEPEIRLVLLRIDYIFYFLEL